MDDILDVLQLGCAVKLDKFQAVRLGSHIKKLQAERDELATENANLKSDIEQRKLIHVGFTNEHQVTSVTEQQLDGYFYPNSDNECYIPLYMLNVHAHRVGKDSEIYKEHCERWKFRKEIAEIRAEAVEEFSKALLNTVQVPNGPLTRVDYYKAAIRHAIQFAEQYAAKVRQGGE